MGKQWKMEQQNTLISNMPLRYIILELKIWRKRRKQKEGGKKDTIDIRSDSAAGREWKL